MSSECQAKRKIKSQPWNRTTKRIPVGRRYDLFFIYLLQQDLYGNCFSAFQLRDNVGKRYVQLTEKKLLFEFYY